MRPLMTTFAAALASAMMTLTGCGDSVPNFPNDTGPPPECIPDVDLLPDRGPDPTDAGGQDDAGGVTDGGRDGGGSTMDAGGGSTIDAGGGTMDCARTEICLPPGKCFAQCDPTTDQPCSPDEMCNAMGACVPRTEPRPDGGRPDVPPSDPCDDAGCPAACRVIAGEATCVECTGRADCMSGAAPICDVARGTCVPFADAPCAPCNNDDDCPTTGTCETRDDFGGEQVCLPVVGDGGTCPTGLVEERGTGLCIPDIGSCTGWRAAVTDRSCTGDRDCVPLGATDFATGTCEVNATDGGTPDGGASSVCLQPCQSTTLVCPAGTSCDTETEFCRSP